MSHYVFAPSPAFSISEHPFVTYQDAFTFGELDQAILQMDKIEKDCAKIGDEGQVTKTIRSSSVAWLSLNNESQWIYDRMAWVARLLNGQFYKFDLHGFFEDMQYTIYNGEEKNHYTWHRDTSLGSQSPPRKLSMILQLNDPTEYEGGDIEILTSHTPDTVTKQRGLITVFPSYTMHRVTPVTSGIRKTLVVWISGPAFK